jgi:hypothetical protein
MKNIFKNKNLKYGSLFSFLSILVVVIGVLVNILAESDLLNIEWDLTANKMYSVSDQTKKF